MSQGRVSESLLTKEGLTPKQEAFCAWYFSTKNGAQSVIKAGYNTDPVTATVMAVELLANPSVKAKLQALKDSHYTGEQAIADKHERMSRLSEIMRSKIETPIRPDHIIQASDQLNKMERVYSEASVVQDNRVLNIYVKDAETKDAILALSKVEGLTLKQLSLTQPSTEKAIPTSESSNSEGL